MKFYRPSLFSLRLVAKSSKQDYFFHSVFEGTQQNSIKGSLDKELVFNLQPLGNEAIPSTTEPLMPWSTNQTFLINLWKQVFFSLSQVMTKLFSPNFNFSVFIHFLDEKNFIFSPSGWKSEGTLIRECSSDYSNKSGWNGKLGNPEKYFFYCSYFEIPIFVCFPAKKTQNFCE